MARPLRIEVPDGVYHVTSRGLERREIVRTDADRRKWAELLDRVATRRRWRVFAWVLMGNHFHLFLQTPDADLSAGMHDLNAGYVSAFNRRHSRVGPLLQGRFKAVLVERQYHYWELSRYVHLNPVRAGLVTKPWDYRWGSCAAYLGRGAAPPWLAWEEVLREHARTQRVARRRYLQFLKDGVASPPPSPLEGVVASTLLGSAAFVDRMRRWLGERMPDREVPADRALRKAVGVADIEAAVCATYGVSPDSLHVRGRWGNEARAVALHLCRKWTAQTISRLGARFGGVTGQAASLAANAIAARLERDRRLARRVRDSEAALQILDF